jgi:hypothetical protein
MVDIGLSGMHKIRMESREIVVNLTVFVVVDNFIVESV